MIKKLILSLICSTLFFSLYSQWAPGAMPAGFWKISGIHMVSPTTGFMCGTNQLVGGNGLIAKTTNGGATWSNVFTDATTPLQDIYFVNENVGYAVGANSTIFKTMDGGNNWSSTVYEANDGITGDPFNAVHFPSLNVGYAVGGFSMGLWAAKTIDGGNNWSELTLPSDFGQRLWDVFFVNDNTGFIVGGDIFNGGVGNIFKTTDGGSTWDVYVPEAASYFSCVYFITESVGFATGNSGVLLKTTDAGVTWNQQDNQEPNNQTVSDVYFINSTVGYACTEGGSVLKTANGGSTWAVDYFLEGFSLPLAEIDVTNGSYGITGGGLATLNFQGVALSVEENTVKDRINIYPNPTSNIINIVLEDEGENVIEIYGLSGELITKESCIGLHTALDISSLKSGIYFVVVTNEDIQQRSRIVKL